MKIEYMTDEQMRDLVKECGLDWHRGYMPLFDGDPTNRYAVLIEAVIDRCARQRHPARDAMTTPRTSTSTLIAAMRALARDIESPDRVANAAILEAAERLEEMRHLLGVAEHRIISKNWPAWLRSSVNEAIK